MLMSYSWALFLFGYGLYFLTPLLPQKALDRKSKVLSVAGIAVGILVYTNLHLGSIWAQRAIMAVRKGQRRDPEMSASFFSERTVVTANRRENKGFQVTEVNPVESVP